MKEEKRFRTSRRKGRQRKKQKQGKTNNRLKLFVSIILSQYVVAWNSSASFFCNFKNIVKSYHGRNRYLLSSFSGFIGIHLYLPLKMDKCKIRPMELNCIFLKLIIIIGREFLIKDAKEKMGEKVKEKNIKKQDLCNRIQVHFYISIFLPSFLEVFKPWIILSIFQELFKITH